MPALLATDPAGLVEASLTGLRLRISPGRQLGASCKPLGPLPVASALALALFVFGSTSLLQLAALCQLAASALVRRILPLQFTSRRRTLAQTLRVHVDHLFRRLPEQTSLLRRSSQRLLQCLCARPQRRSCHFSRRITLPAVLRMPIFAPSSSCTLDIGALFAHFYVDRFLTLGTALSEC